MGGISNRNLAGPGSCMALSGGKRVWRDYAGIAGCSFLEMDFLLNLAGRCSCWLLMPPLFYSCEGRTRGYPTDNEGVSYGQRRKQVTRGLCWFLKVNGGALQKRCAPLFCPFCFAPGFSEGGFFLFTTKPHYCRIGLNQFTEG